MTRIVSESNSVELLSLLSAYSKTAAASLRGGGEVGVSERDCVSWDIS